MGPNKKTARLAGLIYLLVVLTGIYSLMYVPSQLIVWDNPAETVENIKASELLYRSEILAGLLCYIFFLILPLVLYRLLASVHKNAAILMVSLAVVSVPISFANMIHKLEVLSWIGSMAESSTFSIEQVQSQVMLALESYNHGNVVAQAFWGLWLFPYGYLVFKSGFLPKFLGFFLIVGSIGYFLDFAGRILLPDYGSMAIANYITIPASIGEIGSCLWLLIMGIKTSSLESQSEVTS